MRSAPRAAGSSPSSTSTPAFSATRPGPSRRTPPPTTTSPRRSEHRLYVTPSVYGRVPEGPLDYTLKVTRIPMSNKPLLKQESSLAAEDPPYENKAVFAKRAHHKAFKVKLDADRFYIIDMVRRGKGFDRDIDPYLYLEDFEGKVVSSDDDSGGNLNARIVFRAPRSGDYRVIAASLNEVTGPFTLTVRKQLKEKE